MESGGSRSLVVGATAQSPNTQVVTLARNNTFTGGVRLNSGNMAIAANGALGSGPLTVASGTVRFSNLSVTVSNAVALAQDLFVVGASNSTYSGPISSVNPGTGLTL